jgi:hypothetical protein
MQELTDYCIVAKGGHNWHIKSRNQFEAMSDGYKKYPFIFEHSIDRILERKNKHNHDWDLAKESHLTYKVFFNGLIIPWFSRNEKGYLK